MADLRAFRGFRYDLGRAGSLADVICPPYDVIDASLQRRLLETSPHNAIHLELTPEADGDDKYARAAGTLNNWVNEGVLKQDSARSMYLYEQEFTAEGQTFTRRGFLARVRLEPFGTGKVFPHEQTMAGPKADRLSLYRATGFNISPVFGLYPDDDGAALAPLAHAVRTAPPLEATDHLGVIHRFWAVTDAAAITRTIGAMGPQPVYIADGHHRYETGLKYLGEQREAGRVTDSEAPANFCLMMLVGMADPGLQILPTHRLVRGFPGLTAEKLEAALGEHFELAGEYETAAECWDHVQMDDALGFGVLGKNRWIAAKLKTPAIMQEVAPGQTPAWRGLGVSILHKLVLEKLLPERIGGIAKCAYVHTLAEVEASKDHELACLVPACTMAEVELIAGHGELMPAKSTYFYPKIATGLVFHSLKKD